MDQKIDWAFIILLLALYFPHYRPVAVRQGHIIASAFHPELTSDLRWHTYFLREVCTNAILRQAQTPDDSAASV